MSEDLDLVTFRTYRISLLLLAVHGLRAEGHALNVQNNQRLLTLHS